MNKTNYMTVPTVPQILLNFFTFVICCLIVFTAFMTTTTYFQLAISVVLYPICIYIVFRIFPRKSRRPYKMPSSEAYSQTTPPVQKENSATEQVNRITVSDIDRRVFLRLIGGAGIALFLFSLFNRKAESILFKNNPSAAASGPVSLRDSGGNTIDPAHSQPTDGYVISQIDDSTNTFVGYTNKNGSWYIMKQDDSGAFRYGRGDSNFPENWGNRGKLRYDYYNNVFK